MVRKKLIIFIQLLAFIANPLGAKPVSESEASIDGEEVTISATILEIVAQQVFLCKNADGSWKNEKIKEPETGEEIDCLALAREEFNLLKEKQGEDGEVSALSCITRGWSVREKMDFAKHLETLGDIQLPLYRHFGCPGKDQTAVKCTADLACNVVKSSFIGPYLVADLARKLGANTPRCESNSQSSCVNELLVGVIKDVLVNMELIKEVPSITWNAIKAGSNKAWGGIKSLFEDTKELEDASSSKLLALESKDDSFYEEWIKDPVDKALSWVTNLLEVTGSLIADSVQNNFGCAKWSSTRYLPFDGETPQCEEPIVSFECATCSQKLNMMCGVVGLIGGEVLTMYLTGGTIGLAKASLQSSKATFVAGKLSKVGHSLAKTKIGQSGLWAGKQIRGGMHLSAKLGMGLIKLGGNWALRIGKKTIPLKQDIKNELLKVLLSKGKKVAVKVGKGAIYIPTKYIELLEFAYVKGLHGSQALKHLINAKGIGKNGVVKLTSEDVIIEGIKRKEQFSAHVKAYGHYKKDLQRNYSAYKNAIRKAVLKGKDADDKEVLYYLTQIRQLELSGHEIIKNVSKAQDITVLSTPLIPFKKVKISSKVASQIGSGKSINITLKNGKKLEGLFSHIGKDGNIYFKVGDAIKHVSPEDIVTIVGGLNLFRRVGNTIIMVDKEETISAEVQKPEDVVATPEAPEKKDSDKKSNRADDKEKEPDKVPDKGADKEDNKDEDLGEETLFNETPEPSSLPPMQPIPYRPDRLIINQGIF